MPIEIPSPGRVSTTRPTLGSAPDAPRGFFAGRGVDVPYDRSRATAGAFGGGTGLDAVNRAVQGVVGQFSDQLVKVQEIANTEKIMQAEDAGRMGLVQLAAEIQQTSEPSEWFSELERRAPDLESSIITDDMPPSVQRWAKANFSESYGTMMIKMFEKGNSETISRARSTALVSSEKYAREGNVPAALDVLDSARSNNLISEADFEWKKLELEAVSQQSMADNLLVEDPKRLQFMLEQDGDGVSGQDF